MATSVDEAVAESQGLQGLGRRDRASFLTAAGTRAGINSVAFSPTAKPGIAASDTRARLGPCATRRPAGKSSGRTPDVVLGVAFNPDGPGISRGLRDRTGRRRRHCAQGTGAGA